MNFLERYIKRQENRPAKRSLLHTYLISLMSLCLSVTMLLGTTMAWFTSGVEVPENEIYVGTLDVDLLMQTKEANGDIKTVSLKPVENTESGSPKVFDNSIKWYPGHAEVRTLIVEDRGEIPFTYRLSITAMKDCVKAPASESEIDPQTEAEQLLDDETLMKFLGQFEVYTKADDAAIFQAEDLLNTSEWTCVGTMDKLFGDVENVNTYTNAAGDSEKPGELVVFRGSVENMIAPLTGADGEANPDQQIRRAVHSIAIKMSENAEISEEFDFQGYTLKFGIKLVANQLGTPEQVYTLEQLLEALEDGRSVQLMADIDLGGQTVPALDEESSEDPKPILSIPLNNVMINGLVNGEENVLNIPEGTDCAITTTGGTIRNLMILGDNYNNSCAIGSTEENPLTGNLYLDHVTIDNIKTAIAGVGNGKCKVVVTNSKISGAIDYQNVTSVDFVDCKLGETEHAYGSMTVNGNTTFTNCDFVNFSLNAGNIPENTTVTITNCKVNGEKVTADVLMTQLNINGENGNDWSKCTFIIDGVTRTVR